MNFRKKISEILLLTLAVVVGGGYVYYSLLTDTNDSLSRNTTIVFNNTPGIGTNSSIGNISTKGRRSNSPRPQNSITPVPSGTQLPSVAGRPAAGSHATGMLSGNTGYSYSYSAKPKDNTSSSSGGSGVGGMLSYSSRGGRNAGGDEQSGTGGVTLSETGASTPFAAPKTPDTTPPNGNGIYLVDPGTYTQPGNEVGEPIPVGEGWWILMLLALGYMKWKRNP